MVDVCHVWTKDECDLVKRRGKESRYGTDKGHITEIGSQTEMHYILGCGMRIMLLLYTGHFTVENGQFYGPFTTAMFIYR